MWRNQREASHLEEKTTKSSPSATARGSTKSSQHLEWISGDAASARSELALLRTFAISHLKSKTDTEDPSVLKQPKKRKEKDKLHLLSRML